MTELRNRREVPVTMAYGDTKEKTVETGQLGQAKVQDVSSKPTIQQIYQQGRTKVVDTGKKSRSFAPSPPVGSMPQVKRPSKAKDVSGVSAKSVANVPKGLARSGWDYNKSTGKYAMGEERKRQVAGLHKRYLDWRKRMGRRTSPGQKAVADKPSVATLKA